MDLAALRAHEFEPVLQKYGPKDLILYALGLGYGSDPLDPSQLRFVYEAGLQAVPSVCNVLAHPGFWLADPKFGIAWERILHGEQSFELHQPMPIEGEVRGEFDVLSIQDKGAGKDVILHQRKRLFDNRSGALLATVVSLVILRGEGGNGGFGTPPASPAPLPLTEPVMHCDIPTLQQSALIYRLSGDMNPIHVDPAAARRGGLDKPILHGLCTLGVATRGLISTAGKNEPATLQRVSARFSRLVYPGETIRIEVYRTEGDVRFRCIALERNEIVLDRGSAHFALP
jgi:acyl dehydratase